MTASFHHVMDPHTWSCHIKPPRASLCAARRIRRRPPACCGASHAGRAGGVEEGERSGIQPGYDGMGSGHDGGGVGHTEFRVMYLVGKEGGW